MRHVLLQAASARMAGELSAFPTRVLWWMRSHMQEMETRETTIPQMVVTGRWPAAILRAAVATSPAVRR